MKILQMRSFLAFKYIFLFGLAAWFCESALSAYTIGDRVEANGTVNVRQTPAGTFLNTQPNASQGAVIGGPTVASLNGTSYTWWNINFDAGQDGWVADIGLISAPPTVQTLSAASIATTSAQLRGSITPNGSSTSAYFQYGTSTSYGNTTSSGNFGTTSQTITYNIFGLSANTTYHYRVVAQNGTGTSLGNDVTFTTSPQPVPTVSTLAATLVTLNSATLNGTVNPNGANSSFYFDYGTTAGYGTSTSVGNTSISINVGAPISGLSQNTLYHFRFVASNSGGTTFGSDATFTTQGQPVPTVQTLPASSVTTTSATLNGSINPNGAATTAYFQYGTSTAYGSTTISGNFGTNSLIIGTSVFNIDRAIKEPADKPLVIVEGFFDAIKLHQHGCRKVVALMGSTLSATQEVLIRQNTKPGDRIIVMLDENEAGRAGRDDIACRLSKFCFVRVHEFEQPDMEPEHLSTEQVQQLFL